MSKPSIPAPVNDPQRMPFDRAVKECLEVIMGRRQGRIKPLPAGASTDEIVAKINEIIERLQ